MVKKLRDSVMLYPRSLEVSRVDRDRVKKVIAALTEGSGRANSPSTVRLRPARTKRPVVARARPVVTRTARRRMAERSAP
jgi:hypothetical protein